MAVHLSLMRFPLISLYEDKCLNSAQGNVVFLESAKAPEVALMNMNIMEEWHC